jgi:hypothetical protein
VRQKGFTPIVILLIFLVLGGFGYWAYESGIVKISLPQTQNEKTTPSPIPTSDPTINWETYIKENNYSIKYPPNFFRMYCLGEELLLTYNDKVITKPKSAPKEIECNRGGKYDLEIKTLDGNQLQLVLPNQDWYYNNYNITESNIFLDEVSAKQYTFRYKNYGEWGDIPPIPYWYTLVRIPNNGKTIEIYYGGGENKTDLFNQILSTFTFLK